MVLLLFINNMTEQLTIDTEAKSSITLATSVPIQPKIIRSRAVSFTYHDYESDGADAIFKQYIQLSARYGILGYEVCPETKRHHIQGYIAWDNPRSLKKFQQDIGLKKFHYEMSRGTALQNKTYCSKDGNFWEHGEIPQQGERTDWQSAINHLDSGGEVTTVVSEQPHLLPSIRALQTYKNLIQKSTHRDVKVIFLIGSSGTGKTRWAWDNYPELYTKPEGNWWDGYTGQNTILLDDYYGDIPYSQFLKVLDRYPLNLQIKGGFIPANYTTVIITSNDNYDRWYRQNTDAITRRIHQTINFDNDITNGTEKDNEGKEASRQKRRQETHSSEVPREFS